MLIEDLVVEIITQSGSMNGKPSYTRKCLCCYHIWLPIENESVYSIYGLRHKTNMK